MKYQIMGVICMFDLPMDTSKEKRQYRIFRKELVRNGFEMLQYSVYYRTVPNRSAGKKYISNLKDFLPEHGEVRLFNITDKQFDDTVLLVGSKSHQEKIVGAKELVII